MWHWTCLQVSQYSDMVPVTDKIAWHLANNWAASFTTRGQGPASISDSSSIIRSCSLKPTKLGIEMLISLWNLVNGLAVMLPSRIPTFKMIGKLYALFLGLQDFARSYNKTVLHDTETPPRTQWLSFCDQRFHKNMQLQSMKSLELLLALNKNVTPKKSYWKMGYQ